MKNGDLVIYKVNNGFDEYLVWSTGNNVDSLQQPCHLILIDSGDMVIYDNQKMIVWNTNTKRKSDGTVYFMLNDDGFLVLYNDNEILWKNGIKEEGKRV